MKRRKPAVGRWIVELRSETRASVAMEGVTGVIGETSVEFHNERGELVLWAPREMVAAVWLDK